MASRAKKLKASDPTKVHDDARTCRFCNKTLASETFFLKHVCTRKTRYLTRDEKWFKVAFGCFKRTFILTGTRKKDYTVDDFIKSHFFNDFEKLGKFILENNVVMTELYVDYLVKSRTPIGEWSKTSVYEEFVRNINEAETPYDALSRNIMLMEQWGIKMGQDWRDFFRKVPPTLAVLWLRSGKLSPWMIFLAPSSSALIERMSEEQLDIVRSVMDTSYWARRAAKFEKECAEIRAILESEGL